MAVKRTESLTSDSNAQIHGDALVKPSVLNPERQTDGEWQQVLFAHSAWCGTPSCLNTHSCTVLQKCLAIHVVWGVSFWPLCTMDRVWPSWCSWLNCRRQQRKVLFRFGFTLSCMQVIILSTDYILVTINHLCGKNTKHLLILVSEMTVCLIFLHLLHKIYENLKQTFLWGLGIKTVSWLHKNNPKLINEWN